MRLQNKISQLLSQYEKLPLECDGFSRIVHFLLTRECIEHNCYCGRVTWNNVPFVPHFWIQVNDYFIDYKLQMWFKEIPLPPNGIFKLVNGLIYEGYEIKLDCSSLMFDVLTSI
jgi:hypothetical protein